MQRLATLAILASFALSGGVRAADPPVMGWQEAVGELAASRTRAEGCVRVIKREAGKDTRTLGREELAYNDAKAAMDKVIGALLVALVEDREPVTVEGLEGDLETATDGLAGLCQRAGEMLEAGGDKPRDIWDGLIAGVLGPVIEATKDIYLYWAKHDDELVKGTIKTQLEAAKWPSFAEVTL